MIDLHNTPCNSVTARVVINLAFRSLYDCKVRFSILHALWRKPNASSTIRNSFISFIRPGIIEQNNPLVSIF